MTTTDVVKGTLGVVMAVVFGMSVFGALAAVPTGVLMVVNGAVLAGDDGSVTNKYARSGRAGHSGI